MTTAVETSVPILRFSEFSGEWKSIKLAELTSLITKGTTPKSFATKGINFIKIECFVNSQIDKEKCLFVDEQIHNKELKRSILKEYDILFAIAGATIGKCSIVTNDILPANTNQALSIIRLEDLQKLEFVYNILKSEIMQKYIKDNISVGAQPNLNLEQIGNFSFSLPPSLPEQQKIASFLTAIDTKIEFLIRKKTLLEKYKKSVMQQLFSQKIRFKDDEGNEFPEWEEIELNQIASKVTQKNKASSVTKVLTNSAIQGVVNQQDYFDKDIANQDNLQGYFVVGENDFVYNPRISVFAPVGPIKRNKIGLGVMSPLYTVFRFTGINLMYLDYYFETTYWHEFLKSVANTGARHDRMNITNESFFKMPIPVPCKSEQQKIAAFISSIDSRINHLSEQLGYTKTYKKGLLQQLFV